MVVVVLGVVVDFIVVGSTAAVVSFIDASKCEQEVKGLSHI